MQAARAAKTEAAYKSAEATFDRAVQLDLKSGLALAHRGLAKFERSGWFARQGKFTNPARKAHEFIRGDIRVTPAKREGFSL